MLLATLAAGCAGSTPAETTAATVTTSAPAAGGAYQLSAEEKALDCKKLTGRMQVRILQIRDYESTSKGSMVARGLQSAVSKATSSSSYGTSPDEQHARDRAMLDAYNAELAAKNCRTFDLQKELAPGQSAKATPYPIDKTPAAAKKP